VSESIESSFSLQLRDRLGPFYFLVNRKSPCPKHRASRSPCRRFQRQALLEELTDLVA